MTDPDVPLNTRGTPRTRFDPLRDLRDCREVETVDASPVSTEILENSDENGHDELYLDLISAVERHITKLGLTGSPEGAMAVTAAKKAAAADGSAAASCLHELRMIMDSIRASQPAGTASDPVEDVLGRRRERKAGA